MTDFFIQYKATFLLLHVLGVVIAFCGTVMSDTTFLKSAEDSSITEDELRKIKRSGRIVIVGLSLIIFSGVCIYLSDIDKYSHSAKFLTKMTIVAILTANGFLFHLRHIPWLSKTVGTKLWIQPDYESRRIELVFSGALSSASWACAFILGTLKSVPFHYMVLMSFYGMVVVTSLTISFLIRKQLV